MKTRVTTDPLGLARLTILKCEIPASLVARALEPFKKGEYVRRARRTVGRGGGERLALRNRGGFAQEELAGKTGATPLQADEEHARMGFIKNL
jgi:hypothetical protein